MSNTKRTFIASSLLALFMSYLICITLFTHFHFVDGVAVIHTHPLSKAHGHNHTKCDYLALNGFTSYYSTLEESDSFNYLQYFSVKLHFKEYLSTYTNQHYSDFALRGPPSFI